MSNNKSLRYALGMALAIFFALAPSLMAQTAATGALAGTVTDQSGSVIPNVTVTASNTDTGQSRTGMTGADGAYRFGLLPPGNYRVHEPPASGPFQSPRRL
jgi:protocatechuate 3,4-dioxygenase beta subunit